MNGEMKGEETVRPSHMLRLSAIVALGAAAAVMLAAAASAGQPMRETIHVEDEFVIEDFCDVSGLDVNLAFVMDIRVQAAPRGKDGLVYFVQHGTRSELITNQANGRSVSSFTRVLEKDKRITVNDDGTLTVLVLATGNAVLYGANGKAIARNPGQTRFELLIDDAGTPDDFSDDVIEFLGVVKGSTGRTDDFCEAAVPALT